MNEFIQTQFWIWLLCVITTSLGFIVGYLIGKDEK